MSTAGRLAAFVAALAVVLGAGVGLGAAVGPEPASTEAEAAAPEGEGVVSARDGYRFVPERTVLDVDGGPFAFTILGPDGAPVRAFAELHEKDLHLIVVARDLTTFHHVHPDLRTDGTWSVDLPALPAGSYRAIADFQVDDGPRLALGTDLSVPGPFRPSAPPEPEATATVDGFEVALETERGDRGEVTASLTVRRDGGLVADLQPYLGARGHLVALRTGDLAYAHVHPVEGDDEPGTVRFEATLPSAGRYGFFFDFRHDGVVHTAAFTFDQGAVSGTAEMGH